MSLPRVTSTAVTASSPTRAEAPPAPEEPAAAEEEADARAPSHCTRRREPRADQVQAAAGGPRPDAEAFLRRYPCSAAARVQIARRHIQRDPAFARRLLRSAQQLHAQGVPYARGTDTQWLRASAHLHAHEGQWDRALPLLQRLARRAPRSVPAHYNLACGQCQTGDPTGCRQSLERALALAGETNPDEAARVRARAVQDPDLQPIASHVAPPG